MSFMTTWVLGAEIRASRNDKFSSLHGPRVSSGEAHLQRTLPPPFLLLPPCRQTHRAFNPNKTCVQETKLSSSECNQDPSNSYTRCFLGFVPNLVSASLTKLSLKRRYHVVPDNELFHEHPCRFTPSFLSHIRKVLTSTLHRELLLSFKVQLEHHFLSVTPCPQLPPGIMNCPQKCFFIVLQTYVRCSSHHVLLESVRHCRLACRYSTSRTLVCLYY